MGVHLLSSLLIYLFISSIYSFPCSHFESDLYGEINCLRRLLTQCSSDKMNRETRTATSPPTSTRSPLSSSSPRPSTSSLSPSPSHQLTTPLPSLTWNDQVAESSDDWPTPNSALIIDGLKYELSREIESKIREANEKFDAKMASYQVQVEMEMKKLNKEMRLMKLKVHRRSNMEYILSEERESWYTAGEVCTQWGGTLVSVRDFRENEFIKGLIPSSESAWIGLNDIQREDEFENGNGEKTTYRRWEEGQPDNLYHNENCVEVMGGNGRWRDSLCLLTKRFICRRS